MIMPQRIAADEAANGGERVPLIMTASYDVSAGRMPQHPAADLSFLQRVAYGFGHVYNDLCAAMWFSYTLFYLQIVIRMTSTSAGLLVMIGQVADALATPVCGWAVDKFEKRKIWHFVGTILVSISFPLIFTACTFCNNYSELGEVIYYTTVIIIFQIGWALVQISHLSIIPKLTNNAERRSELTAIRYTGAVFSSILVYIVTWAVLHLSNNANQSKIGPDDYYKFKVIISILCGIGGISSVLFYYGVRCNKEQTEILKQETEGNTDKLSTWKLFKKPLIYQVSLLYVASRLYTILNMMYIPLYLDERASYNSTSVDVQTEDLRQSVASVPLVCFIASFVTAILLKYKSGICGNKSAYFVGSVISLLACLDIGFFISPSSHVIQIYICAAFIGIGSSTTLVTSLCLTAEMIGLNSNKGASVYSIVTFTDKLICGFAVVIVEYIKCDNHDDCPEYYRYVLAFVSGSSVILGIFILLSLSRSKAQTFTSSKTTEKK